MSSRLARRSWRHNSGGAVALNQLVPAASIQQQYIHHSTNAQWVPGAFPQSSSWQISRVESANYRQFLFLLRSRTGHAAEVLPEPRSGAMTRLRLRSRWGAAPIGAWAGTHALWLHWIRGAYDMELGWGRGARPYSSLPLPRRTSDLTRSLRARLARWAPQHIVNSMISMSSKREEDSPCRLGHSVIGSLGA